MKNWSLFDWVCWVVGTVLLVLLTQHIAHAQSTTTTTLDEKKLPWPYTNVCGMDILKVPEQYRTRVLDLKQKAGCK